MTASLVIVFGAGGRVGTRLLPLLTGHPATAVVGVTRQHTVSGHSGDPRWTGVDVTDPGNWRHSLDALTNLAATHQHVILVDLLLDRTSVTAMRTSLAAVTSYILRLREQLAFAGRVASLITASTTATMAPWLYQTPYGLAKRRQLARYIASGMTGSAFLLPSLIETSSDAPPRGGLTWTYAQAAHGVATRVIHASSLRETTQSLRLVVPASPTRSEMTKPSACAPRHLSVKRLLCTHLSLLFGQWDSPQQHREASHQRLAATPAKLRRNADHHDAPPARAHRFARAFDVTVEIVAQPRERQEY